MSKSCVLQLRNLSANLERLAGPDVRDQVMAGSEAITESTKADRVAAWVKGAMERLDALAPEAVRNQALSACGCQCAENHSRETKRQAAQRKRAAGEDEFLAEMVAHPAPGTRLERRGNELHQFYTPHSFSTPRRCYCSLMHGLPADQTASLTYCQCSRGYVEWNWRQILGRPVQVEVVQSCIAGADECEFVIHL